MTAFGPTPDARRNAIDFFRALADRFTLVQRTPELNAADEKIIRAALSPSKIYDDSTIWTARTNAHRVLTVAGAFTDHAYHFTPRATRPPLQNVADGYDEVVLTRLAPSVYEWNTRVVTAVGSFTGADFAHALTATFAAVATHSGAELRAGMHVAFPRSARVLGQLYSLDSLTITPLADRTTALSLSIGIHPDTLAHTFPRFAAYIAHYVGRSRADFILTDHASTPWAQATVEHNGLTLKLHVTPDGQLAPLTGPVRPLPDTLVLESDLHTRAWIFGLGVSHLIASVTAIHDARPDAHARGWRFQWQQEPEWHFPPLVEHLIKAPLRRPFAGEGITFTLAIRDSANAPSLFTRDTRLAVQESAIVTWIGTLGGNAMGALAGPTEVEMNAYFAQLFTAIGGDISNDTNTP